jgi:hypothetical protein
MMDVRNTRQVQRLVSEYSRLKTLQGEIGVSDTWVTQDPKIVKTLSENGAVQTAANSYITNRLSTIEGLLTSLSVDITNIGNL